MLLLNRHPAHRKPLIPAHAALLGAPAANEVERFLAHRPNHAPTPLHGLPALADELRVGSIHIKDEGQRLGLGSFKALGGSYAVIRLVLEQATRRLGRPVDIGDLHAPEVRAVAGGDDRRLCHRRQPRPSVAQGAQLVGARAVIFAHSGVSDGRVAAIARYGRRDRSGSGHLRRQRGGSFARLCGDGLDHRIGHLLAGL
ncbi:hypothetical protein [Azospirillum sp. INR13]|uniref:hypothetical protein n=1 Tax=Azospirillum sp. INR13 TaxID=2596919 RepID=UPI00351BF1B9